MLKFLFWFYFVLFIIVCLTIFFNYKFYEHNKIENINENINENEMIFPNNYNINRPKLFKF